MRNQTTRRLNHFDLQIISTSKITILIYSVLLLEKVHQPLQNRNCLITKKFAGEAFLGEFFNLLNIQRKSKTKQKTKISLAFLTEQNSNTT